jgi:hypothetical protein
MARCKQRKSPGDIAQSEYQIRRRTTLFLPVSGWRRFARNFSLVWISFEGRPGPSGISNDSGLYNQIADISGLISAMRNNPPTISSL